MSIIYQKNRNISAQPLERLFASVNWSSAKYPQRLARAIHGSDTVYTAWDGKTLVGLINVLDDGNMTAYSPFLLVDPAYQGKGIGKRLLEMVKRDYRDFLRITLVSYHSSEGFYRKEGFCPANDAIVMYHTDLPD